MTISFCNKDLSQEVRDAERKYGATFMSYWLFEDSGVYLKKIDEDGECFSRDIWVRREGNCYVFEQRIEWYREAPLSKIIPIATVNRGMPEQQLYVYLCEQVSKKIVRLGGQARRVGLGERVFFFDDAGCGPRIPKNAFGTVMGFVPWKMAIGEGEDVETYTQGPGIYVHESQAIVRFDFEDQPSIEMVVDHSYLHRPNEKQNSVNVPRATPIFLRPLPASPLNVGDILATGEMDWAYEDREKACLGLAKVVDIDYLALDESIQKGTAERWVTIAPLTRSHSRTNVYFGSLPESCGLYSYGLQSKWRSGARGAELIKSMEAAPDAHLHVEDREEWLLKNESALYLQMGLLEDRPCPQQYGGDWHLIPFRKALESDDPPVALRVYSMFGNMQHVVYYLNDPNNETFDFKSRAVAYLKKEFLPHQRALQEALT